MKFIIPLIALVSFNSYSQYEKSCLKNQKNLCQEHLNEFASRSNARCDLVKQEPSVCWAECVDEDKEKLAKVRVDLTPDCGRELAYYQRTIIKYYR